MYSNYLRPIILLAVFVGTVIFLSNWTLIRLLDEEMPRGATPRVVSIFSLVSFVACWLLLRDLRRWRLRTSIDWIDSAESENTRLKWQGFPPWCWAIVVMPVCVSVGTLIYFLFPSARML